MAAVPAKVIIKVESSVEQQVCFFFRLQHKMQFVFFIFGHFVKFVLI